VLQRSSATTNAAGIAPGVLLCVVVGGAAQALGALETAVLGSLVELPGFTDRGISFSAKTLLDCAVALLQSLLEVGPRVTASCALATALFLALAVLFIAIRG
jgi:uncharacterized membrane protein YadS